jgi:hypothetical protein
MIIRYLIYFALGYLVYKIIKSLVFPKAPRARKVGPQSAGRIDDVMTQDPHCGTYFPKRDGIPLKFEGRKLLFCSTDCRDKFLDEHTNTTTRDG